MNDFLSDCRQAIKELNDVVDILEKQDKIMDKLEEIGLTPEQKHKFAELFYGCGK